MFVNQNVLPQIHPVNNDWQLFPLSSIDFSNRLVKQIYFHVPQGSEMYSDVKPTMNTFSDQNQSIQ